MLTVTYTGPDAAILGGSYIYTGETRTVSAGQLLAALEHHPAAHFVLISGALPQVEAEQPSTPPATQPDDHPPTPDDQPPIAEEPVIEGAPVPTAPVRQPLPPQRPNQNDRHQRRR
jgi:hypothetical protein